MRGMKIVAIIGLAAWISWSLVLVTLAQPHPTDIYTITLSCNGSAVKIIGLDFLNNGARTTQIIFAFVAGPECNPEGISTKRYEVKGPWNEMKVTYYAQANGDLKTLTDKVPPDQLQAKNVSLGQVYCLNATSTRQAHGPVPCAPGLPTIQIDRAGGVPTLTQWGLLALGLLLAGSLAWMIRRRVTVRPAGAA